MKAYGLETDDSTSITVVFQGLVVLAIFVQARKYYSSFAQKEGKMITSDLSEMTFMSRDKRKHQPRK